MEQIDNSIIEPIELNMIRPSKFAVRHSPSTNDPEILLLKTSILQHGLLSTDGRMRLTLLQKLNRQQSQISTKRYQMVSILRLIIRSTLSGYQITDWNFEAKTLNQISAKREATMAIITAKAQAEQAKQEALTAEEKGKAAVIKAKFEKEVEKQRAVTDAEKKKEVAVISASQKVEVAMQEKLEAEQKKLGAIEYKQERILRGEGDAAYKKLVMTADGALTQKLDAWVRVNQRYAEAISKQKWVPEIQMGSKTTGSGNSANDLLSLFLAKTAPVNAYLVLESIRPNVLSKSLSS